MAASVVFVDSRVSDYLGLLLNLSPDTEIVLLDPDTDGVLQIANWLAGKSGYGAIHVVSHGSSGQLDLGNASLNSDTLTDYADALATIGDALTAEGDLLLYGCNVAEGDTGQAFIQQLSTFTGADVAASTDLTGAAALGGDWVLEASTGSIEAASVDAWNYSSLLGIAYAPPILSNPIADQSAIDNQAWEFYLPNNTFEVIDGGDTLTYSATLANGDPLPDWLYFDAYSFLFHAYDSRGGIFDIQVTATDGGGFTTSDVFSLAVEPQAIFLDPNWQYLQVPVSDPHGNTYGLHTVHADLNLDGNEDLIQTFFRYPLADNPVPIRIMLGDGQGGFTDGTSSLISGTIPGTVHPREVVIDDFNNDGYPDIFVADHGYDASPFPGYTNTLLLSDGTGHYQAAPSNVPATPDYSHSTDAGDIDGDGDADIFVGNIWGQLQVPPHFLVNNGHGVFTRSDTNIPVPYDAISQGTYTTSALLDTDGDNDLDLVLGASGDTGQPSVILRNDGAGHFANPVNLPVGPYGTGSHAMDIDNLDLNADGRMDLIITHTDRDPFYTGRYMQVLVQTTTGSFIDETASRLQQSTSNSLSWQPWTDLVDIDGDSDLDIVIQRQYPDTATGVFLNDGTGVFTEMQADPVLSNFWGSFTLMDVNNDLMPDIVNPDYEYELIGEGPFQQVKVALNGLTPASGNQVLTGDSGANTLTGGLGNDDLQGLAGSDYLNGGPGNDTLNGGNGIDTVSYATASSDTATGVTVNLARSLAQDTVKYGTDILLNIENVIGSQYNDTLTGNGAGNLLNGGGGNDKLIGGAGKDKLFGLNGNDMLNGGAGADTMLGGTGNDTYVVDDAGDIVTELAAQGIDLVQSGITYTLTANVENLTLTGTTAINGTGNGLNNVITGNSAANILTGLAGADALNGGLGGDTMKGNLGNDTYVVDNAGDIVTELAAQGIDLVKSSITTTLTPYVENLTLTGTAAVNATGNGLNNTLLGNSMANKLVGLIGADTLSGAGGSDTLIGGTGNDILTGGLGNDFFVFNTTLNASTNLDTIKDYTAADTIRLENSIFTQLTTTGALNPDNFVLGTAAADANDFLIYNASSGALFYDADANGAGTAVQFATVYSAGTTAATLSAAEFVVI